MDGSVFEKHSIFKEELSKVIKEISMEIFKDDRSENISFQLSPDGSGIGAAIIAAESK